MKIGVYRDLSNANYHGGPGVSKSMLDVLAKSSPLHLHYLRTATNDNDRAPTPAQQLGTAFHSLVLEPKEFFKDYCLALRMQDVPEAIDDRQKLVDLVDELNLNRLPKLPTTGNKPEQIARIIAAEAEQGIGNGHTAEYLEGRKAAELKEIIDGLNAYRPGLLPISGSRHDLAEILRANGRPVTLWSDAKEEWERNNGHRTILTPETWEQLHNMRDAVMAHPAASALLNYEAHAESSVYWNDPETGTLCRCRPDFWRKDGIIVDLKTTEDASLEGFSKSMANYRYHVQHAFYLDGLRAARRLVSWPEGFEYPRAFVFLAVEKSARVVNGKPKGVAVYCLSKEDVELGRLEYRRDLDLYAACERSGEWPGYGDGIQEIALPGWAKNKAEQLVTA